ncbi:MAG: GNAT family N-acetyltransferase, partial [Candidatus Omnitrophota bacterium]
HKESKDELKRLLEGLQKSTLNGDDLIAIQGIIKDSLNGRSEPLDPNNENEVDKILRSFVGKAKARGYDINIKEIDDNLRGLIVGSINRMLAKIGTAPGFSSRTKKEEEETVAVPIFDTAGEKKGAVVSSKGILAVAVEPRAKKEGDVDLLEYKANYGFLPNDHLAIEFIRTRLKTLLPDVKEADLPDVYVLASRGEGINALAFPNGSIVITPEAIEFAGSIEEIDYLILHEFIHLYHAHINIKPQSLKTGRIFESLGAPRFAEIDADVSALLLMAEPQRRTNPQGAVSLLGRLREDKISSKWEPVHGKITNRILMLKSMKRLVELNLMDVYQTDYDLSALPADVKASLRGLKRGGYFGDILRNPPTSGKEWDQWIARARNGIRTSDWDRLNATMPVLMQRLQEAITEQSHKVAETTGTTVYQLRIDGYTAILSFAVKRWNELFDETYGEVLLAEDRCLWKAALIHAGTGISIAENTRSRLWQAIGLGDVAAELHSLLSRPDISDHLTVCPTVLPFQFRQGRFFDFVSSVTRISLIDYSAFHAADNRIDIGDYFRRSAELLAWAEEAEKGLSMPDPDTSWNASHAWTAIVVSAAFCAYDNKQWEPQRFNDEMKAHNVSNYPIEAGEVEAMLRGVGFKANIPPALMEHARANWGVVDVNALGARLNEIREALSAYSDGLDHEDPGQVALLREAALIINQLPEKELEEFGIGHVFIYNCVFVIAAHSVKSMLTAVYWTHLIAADDLDYEAYLNAVNMPAPASREDILEITDALTGVGKSETIFGMKCRLGKTSLTTTQLSRSSYLGSDMLLGVGSLLQKQDSADSFFNILEAYTRRWPIYRFVAGNDEDSHLVQRRRNVVKKGLGFLDLTRIPRDALTARRLLELSFFIDNPGITRPLREYLYMTLVRNLKPEEATRLLFYDYNVQGSITGFRPIEELIEERVTDRKRLLELKQEAERSLAGSSSLYGKLGQAVGLEGLLYYIFERRKPIAVLEVLLNTASDEGRLNRMIADAWWQIFREDIQFDLREIENAQDRNELSTAVSTEPTVSVKQRKGLYAGPINYFQPEAARRAVYRIPLVERYIILMELLTGTNGVLMTKAGRDRLLSGFIESNLVSSEDPAQAGADQALIALTRRVLGTLMEEVPIDELFLMMEPLLRDRLGRPPVRSESWQPYAASLVEKSEVICSDAFEESLDIEDEHKVEEEADKLVKQAAESRILYAMTGTPPGAPVADTGVDETAFSVVPKDFIEQEARGLSPLEFIVEIFSHMGAPGVRFLQLLGITIDVPDYTKPSLYKVYDAIEGQTKPVILHAIETEDPEYAKQIKDIRRRLGGGSLFTVYEVELVTGEREAVRVLNPNAWETTVFFIGIMRKTMDRLIADNPEAGYYKKALGLLDFIQEWIQRELKDPTFFEDDQKFRKLWHKKLKPTGFTAEIRIPESRASKSKRIRREEFAPGQTLTSEKISPESRREAVSLIARHYLAQIRGGLADNLPLRSGAVLVHSDISLGNFNWYENEKTKERAVYVLDRGMYLKFKIQDRLFLKRLNDAKTNGEKASVFADWLWGLDINQKAIANLDKGKVIEELAGIEAEPEEMALMALIKIQDHGLAMPFNFMLLFKNLNALRHMAKEAGFRGIEEAIEYNPAVTAKKAKGTKKRPPAAPGADLTPSDGAGMIPLLRKLLGEERVRKYQSGIEQVAFFLAPALILPLMPVLWQAVVIGGVGLLFGVLHSNRLVNFLSKKLTGKTIDLPNAPPLLRIVLITLMNTLTLSIPLIFNISPVLIYTIGFIATTAMHQWANMWWLRENVIKLGEKQLEKKTEEAALAELRADTDLAVKSAQIAEVKETTPIAKKPGDTFTVVRRLSDRSGLIRPLGFVAICIIALLIPQVGQLVLDPDIATDQLLMLHPLYKKAMGVMAFIIVVTLRTWYMTQREDFGALDGSLKESLSHLALVALVLSLIDYAFTGGIVVSAIFGFVWNLIADKLPVAGIIGVTLFSRYKKKRLRKLDEAATLQKIKELIEKKRVVVTSEDGEQFTFELEEPATPLDKLYKPEYSITVRAEDGRKIGYVDVSDDCLVGSFEDVEEHPDIDKDEVGNAIFVTSEHKRRGIGTSLISFVLGISKQRGIEEFHVINPNIGVIPFYEEAGFETISSTFGIKRCTFDLVDKHLPIIRIKGEAHSGLYTILFNILKKAAKVIRKAIFSKFTPLGVVAVAAVLMDPVGLFAMAARYDGDTEVPYAGLTMLITIFAGAVGVVLAGQQPGQQAADDTFTGSKIISDSDGILLSAKWQKESDRVRLSVVNHSDRLKAGRAALKLHHLGADISKPFKLLDLSTGNEIMFTPGKNIFPDGSIYYELQPGRRHEFEIILDKKSALEARYTDSLIERIFIDNNGVPAIEAGIPNFPHQEWGRDSMISLLGVISIGKFDDARAILLKWARLERDGLIPNVHGKYESSDAALWFVEALYRHIDKFNDASILNTIVGENEKTVNDVLRDIITKYSTPSDDPNTVHADSATGFVYSPARFTWSDTENTPRQGYPVEIQALWFNALNRMRELDRDNTAVYGTLAEKVRKNFEEYFWNEDEGTVFDVLGTEGFQTPEQSKEENRRDPCVRANQIFAVYFGLAQGEKARKIIKSTRDRLLVPGALRTLAPPVRMYVDDTRDEETRKKDEEEGKVIGWPKGYGEYYYKYYDGNKSQFDRDKAYHNGTAWPWLYPFYMLSAVEYGYMTKEETEKKIVDECLELAREAYTGGDYLFNGAGPELVDAEASETLDGAAKHYPKGCWRQAWSNATALWGLDKLSSDKPLAGTGNVMAKSAAIRYCRFKEDNIGVELADVRRDMSKEIALDEEAKAALASAIAEAKNRISEDDNTAALIDDLFDRGRIRFSKMAVEAVYTGEDLYFDETLLAQYNRERLIACLCEAARASVRSDKLIIEVDAHGLTRAFGTTLDKIPDVVVDHDLGEDVPAKIILDPDGIKRLHLNPKHLNCDPKLIKDIWDWYAYELGAGHIWFKGVWQESPLSRVLAKEWHIRDAAAGRESPGVIRNASRYDVYRYTVDPRIANSNEAFRNFVREKLKPKGLNADLDFVTNQFAPDSPLIFKKESQGLFWSWGDKKEFFKWARGNPGLTNMSDEDLEATLLTGELREFSWVAEGMFDDPETTEEEVAVWMDKGILPARYHHSMRIVRHAWPGGLSVALINYSEPTGRNKVADILHTIADMTCDGGIRADLAHWIYWNRYYDDKLKPWGISREEAGRNMPREIWEEFMDRLRGEHPGSMLLGEVYEHGNRSFFREMGMRQGANIVGYNKEFAETLSGGSAQGIRAYLFGESQEVQGREATMYTNHDEHTGLEYLGSMERIRAATAMCAMGGGYMLVPFTEFLPMQRPMDREKTSNKNWRDSAIYMPEYPFENLDIPLVKECRFFTGRPAKKVQRRWISAECVRKSQSDVAVALRSDGNTHAIVSPWYVDSMGNSGLVPMARRSPKEDTLEIVNDSNVPTEITICFDRIFGPEAATESIEGELREIEVSKGTKVFLGPRTLIVELPAYGHCQLSFRETESSRELNAAVKELLTEARNRARPEDEGGEEAAWAANFYNTHRDGLHSEEFKTVFKETLERLLFSGNDLVRRGTAWIISQEEFLGPMTDDQMKEGDGSVLKAVLEREATDLEIVLGVVRAFCGNLPIGKQSLVIAQLLSVAMMTDDTDRRTRLMKEVFSLMPVALPMIAQAGQLTMPSGTEEALMQKQYEQIQLIRAEKLKNMITPAVAAKVFVKKRENLNGENIYEVTGEETGLTLNDIVTEGAWIEAEPDRDTTGIEPLRPRLINLRVKDEEAMDAFALVVDDEIYLLFLGDNHAGAILPESFKFLPEPDTIKDFSGTYLLFDIERKRSERTTSKERLTGEPLPVIIPTGGQTFHLIATFDKERPNIMQLMVRFLGGLDKLRQNLERLMEAVRLPRGNIVYLIGVYPENEIGAMINDSNFSPPNGIYARDADNRRAVVRETVKARKDETASAFSVTDMKDPKVLAKTKIIAEWLAGKGLKAAVDIVGHLTPDSPVVLEHPWWCIPYTKVPAEWRENGIPDALTEQEILETWGVNEGARSAACLIYVPANDKLLEKLRQRGFVWGTEKRDGNETGRIRILISHNRANYAYTSTAALDLMHPEVRGYLFNVIRAWIEAGVSDFRIDMADRFPQELLAEFKVRFSQARFFTEHFDLFGGLIDIFRRSGMDGFYDYRELWVSLRDQFSKDDSAAPVQRWLYNSQKYLELGIFVNFISDHDQDVALSMYGGNREKYLCDLAIFACVPGYFMFNFPDALGYMMPEYRDRKTGAVRYDIRRHATKKKLERLVEEGNRDRALEGETFDGLPYDLMVADGVSSVLAIKEDPVFHRGVRLNVPPQDEYVCFTRTYQGRTAVVVANRSPEPRTLEVTKYLNMPEVEKIESEFLPWEVRVYFAEGNQLREQKVVNGNQLFQFARSLYGDGSNYEWAMQFCNRCRREGTGLREIKSAVSFMLRYGDENMKKGALWILTGTDGGFKHEFDNFVEENFAFVRVCLHTDEPVGRIALRELIADAAVVPGLRESLLGKLSHAFGEGPGGLPTPQVTNLLHLEKALLQQEYGEEWPGKFLELHKDAFGDETFFAACREAVTAWRRSIIPDERDGAGWMLYNPESDLSSKFRDYYVSKISSIQNRLENQDTRAVEDLEALAFEIVNIPDLGERVTSEVVNAVCAGVAHFGENDQLRVLYCAEAMLLQRTLAIGWAHAIDENHKNDWIDPSRYAAFESLVLEWNLEKDEAIHQAARWILGFSESDSIFSTTFLKEHTDKLASFGERLKEGDQSALDDLRGYLAAIEETPGLKECVMDKAVATVRSAIDNIKANGELKALLASLLNTEADLLRRKYLDGWAEQFVNAHCDQWQEENLLEVFGNVILEWNKSENVNTVYAAQWMLFNFDSKFSDKFFETYNNDLELIKEGAKTGDPAALELKEKILQDTRDIESLTRRLIDEIIKRVEEQNVSDEDKFFYFQFASQLLQTVADQAVVAKIMQFFSQHGIRQPPAKSGIPFTKLFLLGLAGIGITLSALAAPGLVTTIGEALPQVGAGFGTWSGLDMGSILRTVGIIFAGGGVWAMARFFGSGKPEDTKDVSGVPIIKYPDHIIVRELDPQKASAGDTIAIVETSIVIPYTVTPIAARVFLNQEGGLEVELGELIEKRSKFKPLLVINARHEDILSMSGLKNSILHDPLVGVYVRKARAWKLSKDEKPESLSTLGYGGTGSTRESPDYKFLTNIEHRKVMIDGIINVLKETRKRNVKTVFVNGVSARPAALFFELCWKKFYPGEALPKFVFLEGAGQVEEGRYSAEKVKTEIEKMPDLEKALSKPSLVFDDIFVTGKTLSETRKLLKEEFGAARVYTAALLYGFKDAPDESPYWDDHAWIPDMPDFYGCRIEDNYETNWYLVRRWIRGARPLYGMERNFDRTEEQERIIFEEYLPHDLNLLASEAEYVFRKQPPKAHTLATIRTREKATARYKKKPASFFEKNFEGKASWEELNKKEQEMLIGEYAARSEILHMLLNPPGFLKAHKKEDIPFLKKHMWSIWRRSMGVAAALALISMVLSLFVDANIGIKLIAIALVPIVPTAFTNWFLHRSYNIDAVEREWPLLALPEPPVPSSQDEIPDEEFYEELRNYYEQLSPEELYALLGELIEIWSEQVKEKKKVNKRIIAEARALRNQIQPYTTRNASPLPESLQKKAKKLLEMGRLEKLDEKKVPKAYERLNEFYECKRKLYWSRLPQGVIENLESIFINFNCLEELDEEMRANYCRGLAALIFINKWDKYILDIWSEFEESGNKEAANSVKEFRKDYLKSKESIPKEHYDVVISSMEDEDRQIYSNEVRQFSHKESSLMTLSPARGVGFPVYEELRMVREALGMKTAEMGAFIVPDGNKAFSPGNMDTYFGAFDQLPSEVILYMRKKARIEFAKLIKRARATYDVSPEEFGRILGPPDHRKPNEPVPETRVIQMEEGLLSVPYRMAIIARAFEQKMEGEELKKIREEAGMSIMDFGQAIYNRDAKNKDRRARRAERGWSEIAPSVMRRARQILATEIMVSKKGFLFLNNKEIRLPKLFAEKAVAKSPYDEQQGWKSGARVTYDGMRLFNYNAGKGKIEKMYEFRNIAPDMSLKGWNGERIHIRGQRSLVGKNVLIIKTDGSNGDLGVRVFHGTEELQVKPLSPKTSTLATKATSSDGTLIGKYKLVPGTEKFHEKTAEIPQSYIEFQAYDIEKYDIDDPDSNEPITIKINAERAPPEDFNNYNDIEWDIPEHIKTALQEALGRISSEG